MSKESRAQAKQDAQTNAQVQAGNIRSTGSNSNLDASNHGNPNDKINIFGNNLVTLLKNLATLFQNKDNELNATSQNSRGRNTAPTVQKATTDSKAVAQQQNQAIAGSSVSKQQENEAEVK